MAKGLTFGFSGKIDREHLEMLKQAAKYHCMQIVVMHRCDGDTAIFCKEDWEVDALVNNWQDFQCGYTLSDLMGV